MISYDFIGNPMISYEILPLLRALVRSPDDGVVYNIARRRNYSTNSMLQIVAQQATSIGIRACASGV